MHTVQEIKCRNTAIYSTANSVSVVL